MENLKPYRKRIARILVVWHSLIIVCSFVLSYSLSLLTTPYVALAVGAGFGVVVSAFFGALISRPIMASTEFLARAILHVSSEQSGSLPPEPSTIKASRDFMERLVSYIYDMASKSTLNLYPIKRDGASRPPTNPEVSSQVSRDLILNSSPLPLLIINSKKEITDASQSALKYMGLEKDSVIGKPFYDILKLSFSSDDTLDNWMSFSEQKSVTGIRTWDRVRLSIKDRPEVKQIDLAARYSKNDSNGHELTLSLFDHSDKYGKDDAGASFVSMAVHELRTPLTVMRGYIEVFEEELADTLDGEQKEFLRNLSAQAQQLGSFVSNIQNLSRIEDNALELQLKQENWKDIFDQALNDLDIRARVRHKTISRVIPDDLPAVAVDRTTIYEVLVNIVENAIKYTHTDEPIVVRASVRDDQWVETTVQDHGIGIPDSLLGHIFDKFYRSHRSSRGVGGTGLGLYIAKTIVEAHGGEIWVKTKEGRGSTFGFTIPTFASVANQVKSKDNDVIERKAHGWIKNHTLYRG